MQLTGLQLSGVYCIYQIISNTCESIGDNKLAVNYLIKFVIKVLFMTPNYVTITITKFHTISEDKKTKIILILKTCLKMYIISQSKMKTKSLIFQILQLAIYQLICNIHVCTSIINKCF